MRVPYDTTKVDWAFASVDDAVPGSFAARVERRRVDLVARVRDGVPPREYHAYSAGMFVCGKRHLIAAPKKSGKSLACLAHWVRLALARERVAVLDRENGADEYSRRLGQIMDSWELDEKQRELVRTNLVYIEHPRLLRDDHADLVRYLALELAADLVCFDSQRMYLADYGLREKDSDDYSAFMAYAVDPLFLAGVSTVILDNTGHADQTRARGTVSKGDLNEVLMHLEVVAEFDRATVGKVRLVVDDSRFGDRGHWDMQIGGGVFGEWESSEQRIAVLAEQKPEFLSAALDVLASANAPLGVGRLMAAVRKQGVKVSDHDARQMLDRWAQDPAVRVHHVANQGYELAPESEV